MTTWQQVRDLEADLREQAALEAAAANAAASEPESLPHTGAGFLGLAPPEEWDWESLRGLVAQRGSHRLFHLCRRYRAAAAVLAGKHDLVLVVIDAVTAELQPAAAFSRLGRPVAHPSACPQPAPPASPQGETKVQRRKHATHRRPKVTRGRKQTPQEWQQTSLAPELAAARRVIGRLVTLAERHYRALASGSAGEITAAYLGMVVDGPQEAERPLLAALSAAIRADRQRWGGAPPVDVMGRAAAEYREWQQAQAASAPEPAGPVSPELAGAAPAAGAASISPEMAAVILKVFTWAQEQVAARKGAASADFRPSERQQEEEQ